MTRSLVVAVTLIAVTSSFAQGFSDIRYRLTEPTFGLKKVKELISHMGRRFGDNAPSAEFKSLSDEERFTYTMIHGEVFSQNCMGMMRVADEDRKLFARVPQAFGGDAYWSDRQLKFLTQNRNLVIKLIRSTIQSKRQVGVNLKEAIVHVGGYELIPDLLEASRADPQDHDILTVMMLLMKERGFKPFVSSELCKKLYGVKANYSTSVMATAASCKFVTEQATAFAKLH